MRLIVTVDSAILVGLWMRKKEHILCANRISIRIAASGEDVIRPDVGQQRRCSSKRNQQRAEFVADMGSEAINGDKARTSLHGRRVSPACQIPSKKWRLGFDHQRLPESTSQRKAHYRSHSKRQGCLHPIPISDRRGRSTSNPRHPSISQNCEMHFCPVGSAIPAIVLAYECTGKSR